MPASIPADLLDLFDEPALGHVSYYDRSGTDRPLPDVGRP